MLRGILFYNFFTTSGVIIRELNPDLSCISNVTNANRRNKLHQLCVCLVNLVHIGVLL